MLAVTAAPPHPLAPLEDVDVEVEADGDGDGGEGHGSAGGQAGLGQFSLRKDWSKRCPNP